MESEFSLACAVPPVAQPALVRLGHGSGGKMTESLFKQIFMPHLQEHLTDGLDDAAIVPAGTAKIAITTDSYVVSPIFFPGGDIGCLAVNGTVNDLCMRGAKPLYITASYIIEEGLPFSDLERIALSVERACAQAGVKLVGGDTKVVNRGAADKIFITTSGVGLIQSSAPPACDRVRAGDAVIVSGALGLHGMAVMCAREGLELECDLESDSAPLNDIVALLMQSVSQVSCMRDLTRGGFATAINEIAQASQVGIELFEHAIPVDHRVGSACELLGLDPLYVACEGRFVAFVPEHVADQTVARLRQHPLGADAAVVGRAVTERPGRVVLKTKVGGRRILDKLSGEQLPRIC